ncbi:MAG: threonine synthase [Bacteroidales bacterium]|nr:threonine synthase [Bacteroidales bacterium]
MKYISTRDKNLKVSFEQAVKQGLAPNKGLFMPENYIKLPAEFWANLFDMTLPEIGYYVGKEYVGDEIPDEDFKKLCQEVLNFEIPLVGVKDKIYSLELFHGPTCAFKDVGARFMARCLGYFSSRKNEKTVILVATSGDTGSAVANGFLNVPGVDVIILYPSGKVSEIQEKQLTTNGGNITALEVNGVFDDCQALVKTAFANFDTQGKFKLTSANSINIARLIPQSFYYYYAVKQVKSYESVICVPSGNFGNITGGVLALKSGLPVKHFVAATNANDTVPQYLQTGVYTPKPSVQTISNAMDVGDPSNFERLDMIFSHSSKEFGATISSYSFSDEMTKKKMNVVYQEYGYMLDPHGAVGMLGIEKYLRDNAPDSPGIFLETAHPAKFLDVVKSAVNTEPVLPEALKKCLDKPKTSIKIENDYKELEKILSERYL